MIAAYHSLPLEMSDSFPRQVPGMALEWLDISGSALEESGISDLARALVASDSNQFVQLASHPLPIQQLMAGGECRDRRPEAH